MFISMLGRYFEHGTSPPPPPPPPKDGDGLRAFNPCNPCCGEKPIDSSYFCIDIDYTGDLAIVNGSGVFPLVYSGLNELGFRCWKGTVSFTNGFAGTARSWIPTGTDFSLSSQGISNASFSHNTIYYGNTAVFPDICDDYQDIEGAVFVVDNNWRGSLANLKPSCNTYDPNTSCGNTSRTFKLCAYHDYQEKNVVFPDVQYEYYINSLDNNRWYVRFKYTNQTNFNAPRPLLFFDYSNKFFLDRGNYGENFCYYTGLLRDNFIPISLVAGPVPFAENLNSLKGIQIFPFTDEIFWSWLQPVYSNDKAFDPEIRPLLVSESGSETVITPSYSTIYTITNYGGWLSTPISGNFGDIVRIFVGVCENTPNLENSYNLSLGLTQYYDDSFNPKFSKTLTHPFFPCNYIEDALSLYEGSNSRNGYYQISEMSANGFFRATVPYPIKRTLNCDFILNRTRKISPYLNCQISTPDGIKNFQMTNVTDTYDPYKIFGPKCSYGNILNMAFGVYYPQCVNNGKYHLYIGQPDKYSCGALILDKTGKETSFTYYRIITNGKIYNKASCGFFENLENIFVAGCPGSICNNNISCCVDYSTWNSTKCDERLGNDFTENFLDQKEKIYSTGFFDISPTNLLNDDPMILSFTSKCPIKITRGININRITNGFILNCLGAIPIARDTYSFKCNENYDSIEYELADVLITELT